MPVFPGVNHLNAVRAFRKAGFEIVNQGKHIKMRNGRIRISIPRHNPIKPVTMGRIITQAGLTVEEFRELL